MFASKILPASSSFMTRGATATNILFKQYQYSRISMSINSTASGTRRGTATRIVQTSRRQLTSTSKSDAGSKIGIKAENVNVNASTSINVNANKTNQSFLSRWMGHKEIPPRGTLKWYGEMVLLCTVFAITGTSTMVLVRPAVSDVLGLKGSLKDGPNSYRVCSIVIMTPLYSMMLVLVGTVFGRHAYFRHFAVKMFSRFGIPAELMDKSFHQTAKNFRKYWWCSTIKLKNADAGIRSQVQVW